MPQVSLLNVILLLQCVPGCQLSVEAEGNFCIQHLSGQGAIWDVTRNSLVLLLELSHVFLGVKCRALLCVSNSRERQTLCSRDGVAASCARYCLHTAQPGFYKKFACQVCLCVETSPWWVFIESLKITHGPWYPPSSETMSQMMDHKNLYITLMLETTTDPFQVSSQSLLPAAFSTVFNYFAEFKFLLLVSQETNVLH